LKIPEWNLAILDEAQAIKNPGARQTRSVKELRARCRLAMTGTPIENRLSDLWSLFDFLCPGLLGGAKEFAGFVKSRTRMEAAPFAPLRRLVRPYILRRLKTDRKIIDDLPDKTEMIAFCSLTRRQAILYQQSVEELAERLDAPEVEGIQRRGIILAFLTRFKQICNHPSQWLGDAAYEPRDSGKFERLRELCEPILLRDVDPVELIGSASAVEAVRQVAPIDGTARMDESELADVFGIEIDPQPAVAPVKLEEPAPPAYRAPEPAALVPSRPKPARARLALGPRRMSARKRIAEAMKARWRAGRERKKAERKLAAVKPKPRTRKDTATFS
jgi:hypothetical protein